MKRSYEGSYENAYETSSETVYGSSGTAKLDENALETFEDYYNIETGEVGTITVDNFAQNFGIVRGDYDSTFNDWKQTDDVDLIVLFGIYDFETGETKFNLEQRFELSVTQSYSPTPTPQDFAPEDQTPTPVNTTDLSGWISYESATINIINDDFGGIELSNFSVNKMNTPDILSKEGDYDLVVYTLVKRSFNHNLGEAYMCDHSEECGGVDSPDPYGYSNYLRKSINGYEDSLSSKLLNIDDYGRLSGYQGDMGFTEITKQSFMSFSD